MLYPQNGSIAMGSRRSWPTLPAAAAVVSLLAVAPRKVPCSQLNASVTSGRTAARRPPKRMASIGTPFGSCHSGAITGHWLAGVVNRALGCAALRPLLGVHGRRSQSISSPGLASVMPSHQTSASRGIPQFVNMQALFAVRLALAFELMLVP